MTPRKKVSIMLVDALNREGFSNVSVNSIHDNIWVPSGGERGLDIARWDLQLYRVQLEGEFLPIHVHSWTTLTDLAKQKSLKLVSHSLREYEVM